MRLSLRKRALVALGLSLSMVGLGTPEAKADYDNERARPGVHTWYSAFEYSVVSITLDRLDTVNAKRIYRVKWRLDMDCSKWGSIVMSGNNQGPHQGLEWDVAFPPDTINQPSFDLATGQGYTTSGLSGDEGFYLDSTFADGSTSRPGWGLTNPNNVERCNGTNPNYIYVTIWMAGPWNPVDRTIVWKASAMTEDPDVPCVPTMAFCMFGDFQNTINKTGFKVSGNDAYGRSPSTPGYLVAESGQYTNKLTGADDPENRWEYHIPNNGNDCQAKFGTSSYKTFCYDSGYYTGGDYAIGDGPPGDKNDVSPRFGDIEGNNLVAFTSDALPPSSYQADPNKKGYATAEATFKCVAPKSTRSDCLVTFGYEGVADSDPAEWKGTNYTIPSDGNWYHCRIDKDHFATSNFTYGHDKYRWKVITDDRWLAFDNAFLGMKNEYANNDYPGNNMFAVPGCTNLGP